MTEYIRKELINIDTDIPLPKFERKRKIGDASTEYMRMVASASILGEKNDCSVKALAVICDVDYDMAHEALFIVGRRLGRGTWKDQLSQAAGILGYELCRLPRESIDEIISKYPGQGKELKNITTYHPIRFKEAWKDIPTLLLDCHRHVAAFKDGVVHDWSVNKSLRVYNLYAIKPKED